MNRCIVCIAAAALCAPAAGVAQTSSLASAVKSSVTIQGLDRHAREITSHPRPSGSPGRVTGFCLPDPSCRATILLTS